MRPLNLLDVPPEILLHIFEFLEPIFLLKTVAQVCKKWSNVIFNRNCGQLNCYKIFYSWSSEIDDVPLLRHWDRCKVEWKELHMDLKEAQRRWVKPSKIHSFGASCDAIDAVRILKYSEICLIGNREKCLDLWSVRGKPVIVGTKPEAHGGWVSCLDSCQVDSFISGGWDSVVKFWKLREDSCHAVLSYNCHRGVMAIAARHDMTAVATFSPTLILLDPRTPDTQSTRYYKIHDKAILDVKLFGDNVVTIGRDLTLRVFDLRSLQCSLSRLIMRKFQGAPKCLAINNNIVFVGDTIGCVHLFNAKENFKKFHRIPISDSKYQITSICPGSGTFVSGGTDRSVRVIAPSKDHIVVNSVDLDHAITSMDYENDVLVVGKANGCIEIHQP